MLTALLLRRKGKTKTRLVLLLASAILLFGGILILLS